MATQTYELRIVGSHQAEPLENVLHFQGVGVDPDDTFAAGANLIAGWIANLEALWLAMLPGTYNLVQYQARRSTPAPSWVTKVGYPVFTKTGSRASTGESMQLCPSIFLVPAMGTKSGGKIFLPAVAQGDIVNNAKIAGYATAISNFETALIAGFTQAGIQWASVVFSRKLLTSSLVITAHTTPLLGYQKNRRSPTGVI